jgi:endogenous inhibitor of DNA gyrase (YacG/DUF329 family)
MSGAVAASHHMEDMSERDLHAKPCLTCGKPTVEAFRPFCSRRCADVDLNRWLSGVYAVPVKEEEDEVGTPATKPGDETSGT